MQQMTERIFVSDPGRNLLYTVDGEPLRVCEIKGRVARYK